MIKKIILSLSICFSLFCGVALNTASAAEVPTVQPQKVDFKTLFNGKYFSAYFYAGGDVHGSNWVSGSVSNDPLKLPDYPNYTYPKCIITLVKLDGLYFVQLYGLSSSSTDYYLLSSNLYSDKPSFSYNKDTKILDIRVHNSVVSRVDCSLIIDIFKGVNYNSSNYSKFFDPVVNLTDGKGIYKIFTNGYDYFLRLNSDGEFYFNNGPYGKGNLISSLPGSGNGLTLKQVFEQNLILPTNFLQSYFKTDRGNISFNIKDTVTIKDNNFQVVGYSFATLKNIWYVKYKGESPIQKNSFTLNATPNDSNIKFIVDGLPVAEGVGSLTYEVLPNTTINWEVTKDKYITKNGSTVVSNNGMISNITLDPEPVKASVNLDVQPDLEFDLWINGIYQPKIHTTGTYHQYLKDDLGNYVDFVNGVYNFTITPKNTAYETQKGVFELVGGSNDIYVNFGTPIYKMTFLTAFPENAHWVVKYDGKTIEFDGTKQIAIPAGTSIEYTVTAPGFKTISNTIVSPEKNFTIDLSLVPVEGSFTINISKTPGNAIIEVTSSNPDNILYKSIHNDYLIVKKGADLFIKCSADGFAPSSRSIYSLSNNETIVFNLASTAPNPHSDYSGYFALFTLAFSIVAGLGNIQLFPGITFGNIIGFVLTIAVFFAFIGLVRGHKN